MKRLLTLLILLVKFQSSFSQSISSDSLVLHLPFDGNAKDISGNHYDGVVNGATLTKGENNMPNSAYYFDGKSSIVIPDIKKLDRPLKAFTILIKYQVTYLDADPTVQLPSVTAYNLITWNRNSVDSLNAYMNSKIRAQWVSPSVYLPTPNLWSVYNWCNSSSTAIRDDVNISDVLNKWRTVAFVYNEGSLKLVDNCKIIFDINYDPSISTLCGSEPIQISLGNVPLDIMRLYGDRYFKGKIDDIQIYTRALTDWEVKLYANSACIEKPFVQIGIIKNECKPAAINFTDNSDMKGMPFYKRLWQINNNITDTVKSFTHTFISKGNYHIKLTIFTDSLTSYSFDTLITVVSTNYIKFIFPADTSVSVCKGSSISFNVNTDAILKWYPCTFLSSCDSKTLKITPANDISYTITGINRAGCKDSSYLKIYLLANDSVYVPNAFTPNGDRLNDTFGP